MKKLRKGQSLVEVLVAVAVGLILIMAAIAAIGPALRSSAEATRLQTAVALARQLLDNVRVFAESSWHNIGNLATTSVNHYYLNTSSSPFTAVAGDENITVGSTTYSRFFYVDDVNRDGAGKIISDSGNPDPSTKKITVSYRFPLTATRTIAVYLARSQHRIFQQSDWTGGTGQEGPVTSTNNRFATSTKIDFTTTTGSIIIKFQ